MLRTIVLSSIACLTIYSTCKKRINCNTILYSFQTNIRAFPDLDSVNIADTIWFEFACPTSLIDNISGTTINFSGAENFGIAIRIFQFTGGSISDPGGVGAVYDFDYKLIYGTFLPDNHLPNENRDYRFAEIGNEYKFKLAIIPKKKGTFTISPGNAANVYREKEPCDKANFAITFANTNQHLYFYEQNRPGYMPSEYERTHMYCFKVK
jgi:hypothetical protein